MPCCVAIGCTYNVKYCKDKFVSLHGSPRDKILRKKWENACGRQQLPKFPLLCSRHFSPDAFQSFGRAQLVKELTGAGYTTKLKPDAVPTIFPHKEAKRPRPRTASENRAKKRQRQGTLDALLMGVGGIPPQPAAATAVEVTEGEPSDSTAIMEDLDCLPAQSVLFQESVSDQCSPIMADAETQTDIYMSDVAVQFPTDVQYAVSRDHVYAGKQTFVRKRKREEDILSQDLFLSDDEISEESQPQTQSDPDYIVHSSEASQSTLEISQASSASHTEDRVFLVFEKQLKLLLQRCSKCGSLIDINHDIKELQNEGSQLTLELTCANSCTYRWQSQPSLSGTKGAGNLLLATSVFFSAIHFSKFDRFCSNMNLKTISEDTYTTLRKKFVFPVVEKTWLKEQSAVVTAFKSEEAEVVLCGDGRCDSPGHSAKYCTHTFLDVQSQKIVDFKVIR